MHFTLLIVPSSERAKRLVATLRAWHGDGLLGEALVVLAEEIGAAEVSSLELNASRLSDAEPSRLLSLLGGHPVELVRIVVVQPIERGTKKMPSLEEPVSRLTAMLQPRLPADARLVAVNVIVPASGVASIPDELLLQSDRASMTNVLVSPEDRVSDANVDIGVDSAKDGNFDGHLALAVSTTAALWRGTDQGPFDERPYPSVAERMAVVTRSFASIVQVEPVIDPVSELVLAPREQWPLPDEGAGRSITALDDQALIDRVVERCSELEGGELRYRPPARPAPPEPKTIGILRAFLAMFGFLWRRLRRMPLDVAHGVRSAVIDRAERLSQVATFGADADVAVRYGGRGARPKNMSISALATDAARVLDITGNAKETYFPPTPGLWKAIRELSLSLVDGSPLPGDFEQPMAGDRRQVVTRPSAIGPNPFDRGFGDTRDVLEVALDSGTPTIEIGDPNSVLITRAALEELLAASTGENQESRREAMHEALAALDAWEAQQRTALLWRLGTRVLTQITRAQDDLRAALAELRDAMPEAADDELSRAWKRCRRWWTWSGAIGALVLLSVWANATTSLAQHLVGTAVTVLLVLGIWLYAFVRFERVEFRILNRAERDAFRLETAQEMASRSARELLRLTGIYEQLVSWSVILGGVLHRPWGAAEMPKQDVPTMDREDAPMARSVGAGATSPQRLAGLGAAASRAVFTRGWLGDCYRLFAETSLGDLAQNKALSALPDPDSDTPQAPNGARKHMATDVLTGGSAQTVAAAGRARVAQFCIGQDPASIVSGVETIAPRLEQSGTEDITSFLGRAVPRPAGPQTLSAEPWTDAALLDRENDVARCIVWAPTALKIAAMWTGVERLPIPDEQLANGGISLKVIRLDCAAPTSSDRLAIFAHMAQQRPDIDATDDDSD